MLIDWDWGVSLQQAPFGNTIYLGWTRSGFQVTITLSICTWIVTFLVGSFFDILHIVPNRPLSGLGTLYVELFHNVPLVIQFFTQYLVIPESLSEEIGMWPKAELDPDIQFLLSSILYLGLFTAVRVCGQVRAVIRSLPREQKGTALTMGLTLPQAYRYVLLPNAHRVIAPPIVPEMVNLVENSAIASIIGLVDMTAQMDKSLDYSARAWEPFITTTLAYVLINAVIMLVMTLVECKVRLPDNMGGR